MRHPPNWKGDPFDLTAEQAITIIREPKRASYWIGNRWMLDSELAAERLVAEVERLRVKLHCALNTPASP